VRQGVVHPGEQAVERDDGLIEWSATILLRPLLKYVGLMDLPYVPIGERK